MNRRTYIKSVFAAGICGAGTYIGFKWFNADPKSLAEQLYAKRDILAEMVETIIPETNTPGAKAAMVHDYILKVITSCNSTFIQKKFLYGIDDTEGYCLKSFNKGFLACNSKEKQMVFNHISNYSISSFRLLDRVYRKALGDPFFSKLRSLTVEGYCMSQLGATKGLAYDYIPGSYEACTPLKPGQLVWATK